MGALTSGNVRISLHPGVTDSEVDRFLAVLPQAVAAVRSHLPGSPTGVGGEGASELQNTPGARSPGARTPGARLVDSRGRRCPLPILDLARALPKLAVGEELTVLADDPAAASDIAAWTRMRSQELVATSDHGDGATAYRVRRLH